MKSQGLSSAVINTLKVLNFLQKGLELGLSTSTLKVQVSALSAFFDQPLIEHRWSRSSIEVKRSYYLPSARIRPQKENANGTL
ncbi:hypothetical protein GDO81_027576 [Engystomops pustulosus]|uniref:Uncharacterized protein n=2 Tax=Engystomops pustulosus TaxID=76066 RepID=A0AAV6YJP9_ENGPU|nr:hypothetical protein GDO81_027576 [Engystomops pustulosus]